MSLSKTEIRNKLRALLLEICDNVEGVFVFPVERAELEGKFPYITMLFGKTTIGSSSKRGIQTLSIIGIVKEDATEALVEAQDRLEGRIHEQLRTKGKEIGVTLIDSDALNLFKPFGLDGALYPPYAGVRFEISIGRINVVE